MDNLTFPKLTSENDLEAFFYHYLRSTTNFQARFQVSLGTKRIDCEVYFDDKTIAYIEFKMPVVTNKIETHKQLLLYNSLTPYPIFLINSTSQFPNLIYALHKIADHIILRNLPVTLDLKLIAAYFEEVDLSQPAESSSSSSPPPTTTCNS